MAISPWLYADFGATPALAEVKPLFDRAAQLLDSDDEGWEDAYAAVVALGVCLVDPRTDEVLVPVGLFIRDDKASWR